MSKLSQRRVTTRPSAATEREAGLRVLEGRSEFDIVPRYNNNTMDKIGLEAQRFLFALAFNVQCVAGGAACSSLHCRMMSNLHRCASNTQHIHDEGSVAQPSEPFFST